MKIQTNKAQMRNGNIKINNKKKKKQGGKRKFWHRAVKKGDQQWNFISNISPSKYFTIYQQQYDLWMTTPKDQVKMFPVTWYFQT